MIKTVLSLLTCLLPLMACAKDETLAAYGGADHQWQLVEVDGTASSDQLTLQFSQDGAVSGAAPCNRFSARNTAPYPWFALSQIAATRRACPALAREQDLLELLQHMTQSELSGNILILRSDDGQEMVFTPRG